MTPSEFKAWFDGFTEAFDKTPSQKQWARIKERVAEIDGKPVTERVYVDRYLPYVRPWQPYWGYTTLCGSTSGIGGSLNGWDGANNSIQAQYYQSSLQGAQGGSLSNYNSTNAMNLLGRAEAQALTQ